MRGAAGTPPPQNRGARSPPPPTSSPLLPPLPRAGGGWSNQSWLTGPLSVWSYDTCQVKKVTAIDEWYHPGTRMVSEWYQVVSEWYQDGIRLVRGIALY